MMFYEANSPLEETVKYEANLPQLPESNGCEMGMLKLSSGGLLGGKHMENVLVIPSTTTPPPITILGGQAATNPVRTQYVKKKDIGHGLKSTMQQAEVKNLSVIAEEAECIHSSRNSAVESLSAKSSSSASSSSTNCKLDDLDDENIKTALFLPPPPPPPTKDENKDSAKSTNNSSTSPSSSSSSSSSDNGSMFDSMHKKDFEFLEDEKGVMLVSAEDIYDKDSLIYI